MVARKKGYIEYEWQNPDEPGPRPKALYLEYFAPWNWMIAVSAYREEFTALMEIKDFEKSILEQRLGRTGYTSVLNADGTFVVHPEFKGAHIRSVPEYAYSGFETVLKQTAAFPIPERQIRLGALREKKLILFNPIPEYQWIVASVVHLNDFFSPWIPSRDSSSWWGSRLFCFSFPSLFSKRHHHRTVAQSHGPAQ